MSTKQNLSFYPCPKYRFFIFNSGNKFVNNLKFHHKHLHSLLFHVFIPISKINTIIVKMHRNKPDRSVIQRKQTSDFKRKEPIV